MVALKLNYPTKEPVSDEHKIRPEELKAPKLYNELESFIVTKDEKEKQRNIDATFSKVLNGRNPFTRIFSAWNDKSRTYLNPDGTIRKGSTKNWADAHQIEHDFHRFYNPGWSVFEQRQPEAGRNVSWEAFVEYIAANPGNISVLVSLPKYKIEATQQ